eukprot:COSAG02_NODE_10145_length_2010_cov_83.400837_2_plen_179_part_00
MYECRTDASKNTKTHFGAAGGWFRLWDDRLVLFFCEKFDATQVAEESSTELEMRTQTVAARLIQDFHSEHGPLGEDDVDTPQYYVLALGDNESVSLHVLNSFKARTRKMRRLTAERMWVERGVGSISLSAHVKREYNTEADMLANMDVVGFVKAMSGRVPGASFCRLRVEPEWLSDSH